MSFSVIPLTFCAGGTLFFLQIEQLIILAVDAFLPVEEGSLLRALFSLWHFILIVLNVPIFGNYDFVLADHEIGAAGLIRFASMLLDLAAFLTALGR